MGFQARARDFPRRNHLISGLSLDVMVIEAALRSGSLITAHAAADQGREVFAAPGSPLDHRIRGANALIKGGATLVESAADVIEALGPAMSAPKPPAPRRSRFEAALEPPSAAAAGKIVSRFSPTPVHLNDLARLLGAPLSEVAAAVVELEFAGRAASLPGGYVALASSAFA
jgi:DNA processing protein